jgi:hypothetical protein
MPTAGLTLGASVAAPGDANVGAAGSKPAGADSVRDVKESTEEEKKEVGACAYARDDEGDARDDVRGVLWGHAGATVWWEEERGW